MWDGLKRGPVFSEGSAEREWVLRKRRQLLRDYNAAKAAGLRVCFMMDIPTLHFVTITVNIPLKATAAKNTRDKSFLGAFVYCCLLQYN